VRPARHIPLAMPLLDGLKVVRSSIHGYGVITTRSFDEGAILLYGDGVLYREHDDFDDTYSLIMPGYERNADGSEGPPMFWDLTCQSRWINHSCDPNTGVETGWDNGQVTAWWVALRPIPAGEELTYDYAFTAEVAEPCACGAATCRGLIVDPDELDLVAPALRRHLRGQRVA
jgi:hypothetical protein